MDTIQITFEGQALPYSIFDKHPHIPQGEVVENKRLGAVLSLIQSSQEKRDGARLASKKLTLREKDRIREARTSANLPSEPGSPAPKGGRKPMPRVPQGEITPSPVTSAGASTRGDRLAAMAAFMERFGAEQKARRKKSNDASNQRKRDRELEELRAPSPGENHVAERQADPDAPRFLRRGGAEHAGKRVERDAERAG